MNGELNPDIGRRDILRVLLTGAGVAAAGGVSVAAAAPAGTDAKKQRARYQPNSPDVQNFYRVNRYPPKP